MKTAKLDISGASFEFHIDENDWCQMKLQTEHESIELGADTWDILKKRLIGGISTLSNSPDPEWILSLAEKHCALYRQNIDGMNRYFWMNGEAKRIWVSELVAPMKISDIETT